jgi:hypothetical protein
MWNNIDAIVKVIEILNLNKFLIYYNKLKILKQNTELYRDIFSCAPDNQIINFIVLE